jgi:hypothetical protein
MSHDHEKPGTLRDAAKAAAKRFKAGWLELGAILTRIRQEKSYTEWDYKTFEDYCGRELFIKADTAHKLTRGYTFLQKHEQDLHKKRMEDIDPPPFEVIEVLAKAEDREQFTDQDYNKLRDEIWHGKGLPQEQAEAMKERYPPPPPAPPAPASQLKRHVKAATALYDALKADRKVPAAIKERAHALLEDLEELSRNHSEARA